MAKLIPVILCGGSGTRLWPLSRKETPKQFLKLMNEQSLLQQTAQRILDVTEGPETEIVTVTLQSLRDKTARQLQEVAPGLTRHILCEPQARNTSAAMAFALEYIKRCFGPDAVAWVLPADHFVGDEASLKEALAKAVALADNGGYMVTFGIMPGRAETGYGYIRKGPALKEGSYMVKEFVEKPDREKAEEFFKSGDYLWNSGMHVFQAGYVLSLFEELAPQSLKLVAQAMTAGQDNAPLASLYSRIPEEQFEKTITEKSNQVVVVPCDPVWSDIGSWESLWEIRAKDSHGNVLQGNVACHEAQNSMLLSHDRLVTGVGLRDIIVVETEDSVLVADKKSNDGLKRLVQTLREQKRQETVKSISEQYPWGRVKVMANSPAMNLKEFVVKPGGKTPKLSYEDMAANWMIVSGTAVFEVDDIQKPISAGQVITIHDTAAFTISNGSETEALKLYEVCYNQTELQTDLLTQSVLLSGIQEYTRSVAA